MRYVITLDLYAYAKNDKEVKHLAELLEEQLKAIDDNCAKVLSIHEQPFGRLESRLIEDVQDVEVLEG